MLLIRNKHIYCAINIFKLILYKLKQNKLKEITPFHQLFPFSLPCS